MKPYTKFSEKKEIITLKQMGIQRKHALPSFPS